ncbi:MAG: hypothetical protein ACK54F_08045 [Planctomycetia bacterium]
MPSSLRRRDAILRGIFGRMLAVLPTLFAVVAAGPVARAADRTVLAVAACDSYADLKKQLGWLGTQIDNPGLAGLLESMILLATQGRGLAGLDVKRPLGAVVTSDGADLAVHGFVPVKDLERLLASLQGITGPVETEGDVRRIVLPSGLPLEITERDGWAVIAPGGMPGGAADPTAVLNAVATSYTVGIETFPGRMSDAVRGRLEAALEQTAAVSAAQGQPVDTDALKAGLASLRQTESLGLGLGIDDASGSVFVENRMIAVPGSVSAVAFNAAGRGTLTVATPAAADGGSPAVRGYVAQTVTEASRARVLDSFDRAVPPGSDDPVTKAIVGLVRELLQATLASGGIDAAVAIDTSIATQQSPLPAMTAGVRINDGPALEQRFKKLFGAGTLPRNVAVKFDTGKAGAANLHSVAIDLGDSPAADALGKSLELTLAVAADYAYVLTGGDQPKRIAAALASSGRADPDAKPIANVQVAMNRVCRYAGTVTDQPQAAAAAKRAEEAPHSLLEVFVRPVDRGIVTRLSADAGVLKAVAALSGVPQAPAGPGGVPLPQVPQALPQGFPQGFPIPVPLPQ